MSWTDIETAMKNELASPTARKVIEDVEGIALNAAKVALEALIPPILRPFIGALVDKLASSGITKIEHLTDVELAKLGTLVVPIGTSALALTVAPQEAPLTPADRVADWPGPQQD